MKRHEYNSLTEQVAKTLEKEIFQGVIPPNSPLPSTRILATRFDVSQRVVLSALDLLEKKDILVRMERKRVFVKVRSVTAGAKEILFFAFGEEIGLHSIYRAVNELMLNQGKKYHYDFFCRLVSTGGVLNAGRLERELGRLENLGFIDCALFYGILSESGMKKCMNLPYPVIFFGELPDSGKLPPHVKMISPNSSDLPLAAAKYAIEKKYREMVFFYWQNPAKRLYEKNAMNQMEAFLQQHDMPFRLIPVPGKDFTAVKTNFNETAPSLAATFQPRTLVVTQNIHSDEFDNRELLPRPAYPDIDLLTLNIPKHPGRIKYMSRNYDMLQNALIEMIESCAAPSGSQSRHVIVDYQYHVAEETSKIK